MSSTKTNHQGPIFIVGYIHTGTTLLQNIISRNPSILTLGGESHFFQDLERIQRELPLTDDPATLREYVMFLVKLAGLGSRRANWYRDDYSLEDIHLTEEQFESIVSAAAADTAKNKDHVALFGLVMDQLVEIHGNDRWLEKTPAHVHYLNPILSAWDDARVIELVRDPRAALASRKRRRTDEWLDKKEAKYGVPANRSTNFDPLIDSMMYKECIVGAKDAAKKFPGRVLTVRYEDLVSEPETEVRRICDFLNLDFRPDMLAVGWINAASTTESEGAGGISKAAIDKWRTILTPDEIHACQLVLGSQMREFDYELMPLPASQWIKTPVVFGSTAVRLFSRVSSPALEGLGDRKSGTIRRMYRRATKSIG